MKRNWGTFLGSLPFFLLCVAGAIFFRPWPIQLFFAILALGQIAVWRVDAYYAELTESELRLRGLLRKDIPYDNIHAIEPLKGAIRRIAGLFPQPDDRVRVDLIEPIWILVPFPWRTRSIWLTFENGADVGFLSEVTRRLNLG
jgi:hypothetical protein